MRRSETRANARPAQFVLCLLVVAAVVAPGCADPPLPPRDGGSDAADAELERDTHLGDGVTDTGRPPHDADAGGDDADGEPDGRDTMDTHLGGRDAVDSDASDANDASDTNDASDVWTMSPRLDWSRLAGGTGTETTSSVTTGSSGSIYIGGWTDKGMHGRSYKGGLSDGFVAKYKPTGSRGWTRLVGSAGGDGVTALQADGNGNLFVGGETDGDLHGRKGKGKDDAYLARYDASGTRVWTRLIGSSDWDSLEALRLAPSGDLYVVGYSSSGLYGRRFHGGRKDAYVAKYGPGGVRKWTRMIGTKESDYGFAVAVDASNDVYVGGETLGPLHGKSYHQGGDAFVVKFDSTGSRKWTRLFGTKYLDEVRSMSVDTSGNLYVAGQTGEGLFGHSHAGSNEGFLSKYRSNGTRVWTRMIGSSGTDFVENIAVVGAAGVVATGRAEAELPTTRYRGGESDAFLVAIDAKGNRSWGRSIGTAGEDEGVSVTVDASGTIHAAGWTTQSLNGLSYNGGDRDGYLMRLKP